MSADGSKYHATKTPKDDPHVVNPQVVADPSLFESVAGFINDVVPGSNTTVVDQIQWLRFEHAQFDELSYLSDREDGVSVSPPMFLVVGYNKGAQVWCISATGEAKEIISWKHLNIKTLRILPSPYIVEEHIVDLFKDKRPLIAICDNTSSSAMHFTLSFISLKTGQQVHHIKFKNQVMDLYCNKTSVVVTFLEKITVLDAFSLKERCTVTTCYLSPGIHCNPIALGPRWLAFADKTSVSSRKSAGGFENEGVQSYKASVITVAKTITQGFKDMSETLANSLTGSSTFKPSVVCPGSPQSGGPNDCGVKGIVTILDTECHKVEGIEGTMPTDAIIAHFTAHSDAIVQLEFDKSGMLLLTADNRGHDFHVFRIHPHPLGPNMASAQHLYTLHRGDTSATIQSMSFSSDSRWVAVASSRGTTHVFPITPYGGNINNRTHTKRRVVNKLSRYHSSAGLSNEERPRSPIVGMECSGAKIYPFANPRHAPFPSPTVLSPLAQIKPMTATQNPGSASHTRSSITRQRSSSSSEDVFLKVVTCFASSRAHLDEPNLSDDNEHRAMEHLFVMNSTGLLLQYDLEPMPYGVSPDLVCDDTPIHVKVTPRAQWNLQRRQNAEDVKMPLAEQYLEYFVPSEAFMRSTALKDDSYWLSQVEIVTHAGPHRRLWMGPQFVFKTYTTVPGVPFSLTNIQQVDLARSKPVNMPATQNAVLIECGSANSRELSPPVNTYHATVEPIAGLQDLRLKENLAEAMLESSDVKEDSGHRVFVSLKPQAMPVAKVVNPLGTVVTIQSDEETEQEEPEEPVIHENYDETLFRPIVVSKPAVVHTDGKPHTNPIDTMLVRSLDESTEVAVKLLKKSKNPTSKKTSKDRKHIIDKPVNLPTDQKTSDRNTNIDEKKELKTLKDNEERSENKTKVSKADDISKQFDSYVLDENKYSSYTTDDIDCGLVFDDNKQDFNIDSDFPYLDNKNEDKETRPDMFEDATDCYEDLYINIKKEIAEKNDENLSDEKITTTKPRKPKAKLGVRIPNKHFPIKNEEDVEPLIPKRSWSSVAATKPKEKVVDISEKENCDLMDLMDEKGEGENGNVEKEAECGSPSDSNATPSRTPSVNSDGALEMSGDVAFL